MILQSAQSIVPFQEIIELGPFAARFTDLARLLVIPVFAWIMWKDIQTRRVPNLIWTPLTVFGLILLYIDFQRVASYSPINLDVFIFSYAISIGLIVSLAILFHYIGGFGGADARAFMVIAILFPFYPNIQFLGVELPLYQSTLPVFSFTVLVNSVLWGVFYPLILVFGNILQSNFDRRMLVGVSKNPSDIETAYGKLLHQRSGDSLRDKIRGFLVPRSRGLDLDALRMYLRWRGITLTELRSNPELYRDPRTIPEDTNDPTDGSVAIDSDEKRLNNPSDDSEQSVDEANEEDQIVDHEDPWGAEQFLTEISHSAYGTSPETLRHGLSIVAERDTIWISPGIPFLVPVFIGIMVSYTLGDTLIIILEALGLL